MPRSPGRTRLAALLTAALLLAAAMGSLSCGEISRGFFAARAGSEAPELAGLTEWINGDPITLESARAEGRVVLVDFWTYTCVNCLRTLPYLRQWHDRYAEAGLTILGVHAPEFEFERDPVNVRNAVAAADIRYPVALDNEMATWRAFANYAWPAKYLVGADGRIRYVHIGEGDYPGTEYAIRAALTAAGRDVSAIPTGGLPEPERDAPATRITRELYGGYERNYATRGAYAAQREYYEGAGQVHEYTDIDGPRQPDVWYLQGAWRADREAVVHARETTTLEDYLAFRFTARSVNVVMQPRTRGSSYDVVVELDGRPLRPDEAGPDIRIDTTGRSIVTVDEPRMYALVILPALGDHDLALRSNSADFAMYAVTFGAYTSGS